MPKAKKAPDEGVHVPEAPKLGREVVYSILVPFSNNVEKKKAQDVLHAHAIPRNLIVTGDKAVSVRRLFTRWQGDKEEAAWQRAIQDKLPGAVIDVQDWSHDVGYPMGDDNA